MAANSRTVMRLAIAATISWISSPACGPTQQPPRISPGSGAARRRTNPSVTGVTSQHSISRCAARKVWFSRDSRRLAALSDDWHLAVWDLVRRHVLFVFQTPKGELADSAGGCFDADGDRFAFATGREACLEGTEAPRVARLGERLLGSTANRLGRALMGVGFQPGGHAVGVGHRGGHGPGGRHRRGETAVGRTRSPGRRMMT